MVMTEFKKGLPSYPKVYAIGHASIPTLFVGPVLVQEKVDGSQFNWGLDANGEIKFRSKGAQIHPGDGNKMFDGAVQHILERVDKLVPGLVYRGEVLMKPKHNTIQYDHIPPGGIALFDITDTTEGPEHYAPFAGVASIADLLEVGYAPILASEVNVTDVETLKGFLDTESFLGGASVEGIVVKNYSQFNEHDGKVMMGKLVSVEFQEKHQGAWKASNPTKSDIVDQIVQGLRTDRRWEKAIEHLRDDGRLLGTPADIGPLIAEVQKDVYDEEAEQIKETLFNALWKKSIGRGVTVGLAEWYKDRLVQGAFGGMEEQS